MMNTWTIYRSYFEEWRWEERDDHGRVVRESEDGFETCLECVENLLVEQHAVRERVLH